MKVKFIRSVTLALLLLPVPFMAKSDNPGYMIVVDKEGNTYETPMPEVSRVDFDTFSFAVQTNDGKTEKYDYDKVTRIDLGKRSGVSLPVKDPRLAVWPGVATTTVNVTGTEVCGKIDVISLGGVCVRSVTASEGVTGIDVSDLAPGQYILRSGNEMVRFIKK